MAQGTTRDDSAASAARDDILPLVEALQLPELVALMAEEGNRNATELQETLFPESGQGRWADLVEDIYRPKHMIGILIDGLTGELSTQDSSSAVVFFNGDLGRRIVRLEVSARRAMSDPSIEAASGEALASLRATDPSRFAVLDDFVRVNDLVEMNVVATLNANYAFFNGLNRAGAYGTNRSDAEILEDIWLEEPAIRADTETWVYSYLAMAYGPLSNAEIDEYTAFSATPEGRALNAGLFAAYDVLFERLSRDLGMAAAQFVSGEDI